ncbi:hypothetical protein LguiB_012814 [Lonicera macranthoides]
MAVTEKCDVYSFGVVALEILIGKHPGDLLSSLTSASTRNSTMNDVLDPRLSGPIDRLIEWDIVMVMRLAFSCISSNPKSRPTMQSLSHQFLRQHPLTPALKDLGFFIRGIDYCVFSAPSEVSMGVISSQSLVIWEMIVVKVIGGYVPCP